MNRRIKADQSGSFLLLVAAFMLPVAFLFATYTLDIYYLNEQRSRAQQAVDQAALVAANKLPYTSLAQAAAEASLTRTGYKLGSKIRITTDDVEVKYTGTHKGFLARFARQKSINYRVYSATHVNSKDVVIFMDASSYLAPQISTLASDSWNTNQNWPRAQFFHEKIEKHYNDQKVPPRILTQQCWNSAFSSLKEATIRLYDYFSSYGRNSVGLMIGPGNLEQVTMIRPTRSAFQAALAPGEGRFDYFKSRYASDELCLAASQYERRHSGYNFPPRSSALPATLYRTASFPLVNNNNELPVINLQHLAVRDIIWTTAVRREYGTGTSPEQYSHQVDFRAVLNQSANALLSAEFRPERKAVSNQESALAILMLGDLPWIAGWRLRSYPPGISSQQIRSLNPAKRQLHVNNKSAIAALEDTVRNLNQRAEQSKRQLQFYISFTRHLGNYPPSLYPGCVDTSDQAWMNHPCREFIADGEALENILLRFERQAVFDSKNVIFRVFRSPNVEGLSNNLAAWLPLADRTIYRNG